jgi:hypothetical protein
VPNGRDHTATSYEERQPLIVIMFSLVVSGLQRAFRFFSKIDSIKKITYKFTSKGPTESKLTDLINLSIQTASKELKRLTRPKETAIMCYEITKKARTYCSRWVIRDLSQESLRERDYVLAQWRLDFVRPDKYHITQAIWDVELGELWDEWVAIGKENYQNSGLWIRTEDGRHDELNRLLLVENLLDFLRNEDPISSDLYGYLQKSYLLLEYKDPISSEFGLRLIEEYKDLQNRRFEVRVWIDLETGFLAKGEVIVKGKTSEGEHVHGEVQQVFTSYNQDVKVNPPPWLNAVPNDRGELICTDDRVPTVRHHP